MCGTVNELSSYHEYYRNNLELEITSRRQDGSYYSEPDLWMILYSLISAAAFLEKFNKNLDDVRPKNVFVTQDGQLKLLAFGDFPDDMPAFLKAVI